MIAVLMMVIEMKFISSDTNIWIDFSAINKLDLPFRLPYTYIMNDDAIEDELLNPPYLKDNLLRLGLKKVELDFMELQLADSYGQKYKKLSIYDRIALAIAKNRKITLLTGDRRLRNAAKIESVEVIGTLGILDKLYISNLITDEEYDDCLTKLKEKNGKEVRLPMNEIEERLTLEKKY